MSWKHTVRTAPPRASGGYPRDVTGAGILVKAVRSRFPWLRPRVAEGASAGPPLGPALPGHGAGTIEIIKRGDPAIRGGTALCLAWAVPEGGKRGNVRGRARLGPYRQSEGSCRGAAQGLVRRPCPRRLGLLDPPACPLGPAAQEAGVDRRMREEYIPSSMAARSVFTAPLVADLGLAPPPP